MRRQTVQSHGSGGPFWLILALIVCLGAGCASKKKVAPQDDLAPIPADATPLFDGNAFSQWTNQDGGEVRWHFTGRVLEIKPQTYFKGGRPNLVGIQTRRNYTDFRLHVEFRLPIEGETNSGVYLQRRYELQIVDSFGMEINSSTCGAINKQRPPDKNACGRRGEWQSLNIAFRAARFHEVNGKMSKTENARLSVLLNDVVIHNDVELTDRTGAGDKEGPEPGPILLQDYGGRVQFRNVWIAPLMPPTDDTKGGVGSHE
ncbi:MAG TPA: DUF1080 domain-containing protein [Candidatus Sumerlaeota bacterium]|nr:DUF1080 domain-containing protein [Candidatus Sumerlaeota bacterium]